MVTGPQTLKYQMPSETFESFPAHDWTKNTDSNHNSYSGPQEDPM